MRFHPIHLAPGFLLLSSTLALATSSSAPQVQTSVESVNDHCSRLAKFDLPSASISSATAVAAGTFNGPPQAFTGADMSALYKMLPAFCRIVVQAKPSADSNIGIEVWMPVDVWNGKLEGIGNGGFAGIIDDVGLGAAVAKGYAAVATDAGHTGSPADASWALGHPEKVIDFGHRGVHEMTRVARLLVQQFYGSGPKRSYFDGCSDGGREALMEAQRYPDDYDGILAGAPANYWTGLLSLAPFATQALTATPASYLPPAKIPVIAQAVLAACDKLDGVADGILNDPRQCHFDTTSIQCKAGEDAEKCLSSDQVVALKTIYGGLRDSGGRSVFPGYLPGAEDGKGGWGLWITGPAPAKSAIAILSIGYFSNMVYEERDWDYKSFTEESDLKAAKGKTSEALDAVNPDLSAFRAHGGKLILYHGWNDPAIPAVNTVNYYQDVIAKMGQANTDSFVRLYMVPGMQHCGGGPGPDAFGAFVGSLSRDPQRNVVIALENWVEKGPAPATIIASKPPAGNPHGVPIMTRPLCPYPLAAKYKGTGDTNSAESFVCANPNE